MTEELPPPKKITTLISITTPNGADIGRDIADAMAAYRKEHPPVKYGRIFWHDLAERAISTYVQALLGLLIVSGVTDLAVVQTAAVAAIPAALSAIKSTLAEKYAPGTISPASLAPR
jgi:hypothetical protein